MQWRDNSDFGTRSHVCRLAWPDSANCAVGILPPAPLNLGSKGPKSAEIAKIAPAPERAFLGRQDELEGLVGRSG